MKKSWSFISMLAALALGTASAAGTTAGTQITNSAEIVFTPEVPRDHPEIGYGSEARTTGILNECG